jgi:hypothetical protein
MKKFNLLLAMAALAISGANAQTVTKASDAPFDFSKVDSLYVIYLGEETLESADASSKVVINLGPDDINTFLYVWDGASSFGTAVGPNSFGVAGEYMDFVVGSAGWSGIGYYVGKTKTYDLSKITADYYLHMAFKAQAAGTFDIGITDGKGTAANLAIGTTPFVDNGKSYEPIGEITRNGEWYNIDVPMTALNKLGLNFSTSTAYSDKNVLFALMGGTKGFTVDYDGLFFYKPISTGVSTVKTDNGFKAVGGNGSINVTAKNGGIQIFNVSGALINSTNASSLSVDGMQSGIYIVRNAGHAQKVLVK